MNTTFTKLIPGLLFLVLFIGCSRQKNDPELILRNVDELVSSDAITPEGGNFVLEIYASLPWSVAVSSDNSGWIKVAPSNGNAGENPIVVTTDPNSTQESRSASIKVSCGNISETFYVTQGGVPKREDVFEVSPETVEVSYEGGRIRVAIRTNLDYTIDVKDEWITLLTTEVVQEGNLEFEVAANDLNKSRTGTISFVAGEYFSDVSVMQEAAQNEDYFEISQTSFDVPASGGNVTVGISTNMDYTLDIVNPGWISLISGAGVKEGELVFRVDENGEYDERNGMIVLCAGTNCYNIKIRQEGRGSILPVVITADVTSVTSVSAVCGGYVASDGGKSVTSRGVVWSTSQNPTVELLTKTNDGSGNGQFSSTVTGLEQNTTYYVRAYATNANGTSYGEIRMFTTEEEDRFEFSPSTFDVTAEGGEITIDISTNMDYTVQIANPEWITQISGVGVMEGELVFRVAENIDENDRAGMIMLCAGSNCYNVIINQAGKKNEDPSGDNEDFGNDDEFEL